MQHVTRGQHEALAAASAQLMQKGSDYHIKTLKHHIGELTANASELQSDYTWSAKNHPNLPDSHNPLATKVDNNDYVIDLLRTLVHFYETTN